MLLKVLPKDTRMVPDEICFITLSLSVIRTEISSCSMSTCVGPFRALLVKFETRITDAKNVFPKLCDCVDCII